MSKEQQGQKWKRWGLWLLGVSVFAPLLSIGSLAYFYLKQELDSRRAIAFMNFEQQAYRIKEMLRDETRFSKDLVDGQWELRFTREPRALLLQNGKQLVPAFGQITALENAQLAKIGDRDAELETFRIQGQLIILSVMVLDHPTHFADRDLKPGVYRAIWNLDPNLLPSNLPNDTRRLYIINQPGSLIFSSRPDDSEELILKQPLVQDFIKSPLSRAGTPLRITRNGGEYGFYMTVPDSNLTLFVESSSTYFFAPLMVPMSVSLGILLAFMGLTIMIWRSSITSLGEQVHRLSHALDEFSRGYLIPTQLSSESYLIELRPLVESINKNTRGVRDRVDLIEKQKK